ncbi:hypothetical protein B7463_g2370, partial [Scytalidium lignicola]
MGLCKSDKPQQQGKEISTEPEEAGDDFNYPSGLKLAAIMASVFIAMFLVALDKLIIATVTPTITNEFHASNQVGWYGTAYLLTNCSFLLVFGKLYTFLNVKNTFLFSVVLFEVGSAICGAAPNSVAFIFGRAIAGLGAGGVQQGSLVLIVYAVPLAKRPQYQGLFGAVYGISSIIGPLVGGAFTSNVSWRWCFYINLPFGAVVFLFIFFLLHISSHAGSQNSLSWKEKLEQLNIEGVLTLLPGVVCLCLALEWGGFTYSWSNRRIVALLIIGIVLLIAFVLIQVWRQKTAMVPPHIFIQRSIFTGFWVSCMVGAHLTLMVYFLPIWFQTVKGSSPVQSGVHLFPMVISLVVSSITGGIGTTKIGYYTPFLLIGCCIASVGAGLLTLLKLETTTGQWIGYQIVYGFGLGLCFQAPNMAAQTVLPRNDVSIGASLMLFGQTLFSAIFVSVGQNVLDQHLASRLARISGINLTPNQIEASGITGLFKIIPLQSHDAVLQAYDTSLRLVFVIVVVVTCLSILGGAGMEWRSVKKEGEKQEGAAKKEIPTTPTTPTVV